MTDKNKQLILDYFKGDELAANVWESKYKSDSDITPDDMHHRMTKEFFKIEKKYINEEKTDKTKLSEYGKTRKDLTYDSIYNLFKDFKYIVPQGSIMATLGTDVIASLSNCWVVPSPLDSYASINKTDGDLIYYYKRRGGCGLSINNLRPNGVSTNNAAKTTTGAVSFMERFSNTTREVAMNGRRGALMIAISINHPDSLDFIKIKSDKTKVTGANISVMLTNEYMNAVETDSDYLLRFPIDLDVTNLNADQYEYGVLTEVENGYIKRIKAKEYWDELIVQARDNAEPGLMYWDRVLDYDPSAVYDYYKPIVSNPCGEQFLNANDSCRLMAYNLLSFIDNPYTENAVFNYKKWYEYVYEGTRLGDNLVDLEAEYIQRIIDKIESDPEPLEIKQDELNLWKKSYQKALDGRRMGMGITAVGDMIAALGIKYGSNESLDVMSKIFREKMRAELDSSIDMSNTRGSFNHYDNNVEFSNNKGNNSFYDMLIEEFPNETKRMMELGRRNVNWSTVAPTGSVSILTQTTSGIEPIFKAYYTRRKKINENDSNNRVDFVDELGDRWTEFVVVHQQFKEWIVANYPQINIDELTTEKTDELFKLSPWYESEADDIDWIKRVEIQSIIQKYISNAISSTINLPEDVTNDKVSEIYLHGWKHGLKGQTIYRDGSRSGVLVSNDSKQKKHVQFEDNDAFKRPKDVECFVLKSKVKGVEYKFIIGLIDGRPYETFIHQGEAYGNGIMRKKKKGEYIFIKTGVEEDNVFEEQVSASMTPEMEAISRMASWGLRHGGGVKHLVNVLRSIDAEIFEFVPAFIRALNKFIKTDDSSGKQKCPQCSEETLLYEEGCSRCLSCGYSACN